MDKLLSVVKKNGYNKNTDASTSTGSENKKYASEQGSNTRKVKKIRLPIKGGDRKFFILFLCGSQYQKVCKPLV